MEFHLPALHTGNSTLDKAFRIAIGDFMGNVVPFRGGLLGVPRPVILAGLDYDTPWTRDAAINVWNAGAFLMPEASRNTLISVLEREDGNVIIGGQYWDAIIWVPGAWFYYLATGDREFLSLAFQAARNSIAYFEANEFAAPLGLFRGPACYGDGVAAYPDIFAQDGCSSSILDWPRNRPDLACADGYGIPMHALSTNCLYYRAYRAALSMARELGGEAPPDWPEKADRLKDAINREFWAVDKGFYRYLAGPLGACDHQEALGHSFALLFGVADSAQARQVLTNQHVTAAGVPCVWPTFGRYSAQGPQAFGRHSGTVWPHAQGFWADAAASYGKSTIFGHEFIGLAGHACRDTQFTEIYHPVTTEAYGGIQEEGDEGIRLFHSCRRQTWSATAYLRMAIMGLMGVRLGETGIRFQPCVPEGISHASLDGLRCRRMTLNITVEGTGTRIKSVRVNGRLHAVPLALNGAGQKRVEIEVEP